MELMGAGIFLLLLCVTSLMLSTVQKRMKQGVGKLPPGPTALPFLGNALQLNGKEIFRVLLKLSEKYGSIFTIHLGSEPVVVLCGYEIMKEALNDHGEWFAARGSLPIMDRVNRGHGVINSNGERWKQLRRFSLMTLRNFGMGKRSIEERIQEEAQFLTEELKKTKGNFLELPFDPTFFFSRSVSNVISSVVFGDRFDYEDGNFLILLSLINDTFRIFSSIWVQLYNFFPNVMEYLPGPHKRLMKDIDQLKTFVAGRVKKHQETLDPTSPRDFIDCFLLKMEQEKNSTLSEFSMENLVITTLDLFSAGTETVSTTLRYGLMILLKHPDVEAKIHEEIDRVIGQNRCPTNKDRNLMPYTEAVVHEIQRFIDIIPLGLPHAVTQDILFRQYVIPKGTTVYPMLSSVLRDPKQYQNPESFDPGHFLDAQGCFKRNDAFMPFSSGRRVCLGEGLAHMEIFLFLTTILQNFNLKSPVDPKEIDLSPEISGFGNMPRPYQLCLLPC
ncbi:cytochrome P450 2C42-like isoform X2 [Microcaecilia unicolor]|uniref:unspecific monooxygenase n=1 Tax=Microcaecilia unicolor TaxID=1415580 RepID=A0A6P7ZC11_9AMPH|nr:cytochrome P450 2C42-like isoform X2 [Microcaecilia unicolor]